MTYNVFGATLNLTQSNLSMCVLCICGTYYCSLVFEVNVSGV